MRKLDTSPISQAAQFPPKAGTLDHLQLSYQEALNALAVSIIGVGYDPTVIYILFGCVNNGVAPAVNISGGALFYNGEVYLVDQTNFFLQGGQVAIPNVQLTFNVLNADPVLFTDNAQRRVHQIRKIVIVPGASQTGLDLSGNHLPDFAAFHFANPKVNVSGNIVGGAFPNFTVNQTNKLLKVGTVVIGNVGFDGTVLSGALASLYNAVFPDIGTNQYIVTGNLRSNTGTSQGQIQDSSCAAVVANYSNVGFSVIVKKKDNASGNTNLNFDYQILSLL